MYIHLPQQEMRNHLSNVRNQTDRVDRSECESLEIDICRITDHPLHLRDV